MKELLSKLFVINELNFLYSNGETYNEGDALQTVRTKQVKLPVLQKLIL